MNAIFSEEQIFYFSTEPIFIAWNNQPYFIW